MVTGDRELSPVALLAVGLLVGSAGLVQMIIALRMRRRFRSQPDREVDMGGMFANPAPEPAPRDPRDPAAADPGRWFMILVLGAAFTAGGAAAVVRALLDLLR